MFRNSPESTWKEKKESLSKLNGTVTDELKNESKSKQETTSADAIVRKKFTFFTEEVLWITTRKDDTSRYVA